MGRQKFLVLPGLQGDGILGTDFLEDRKAIVNYERAEIAIGRKRIPLESRAALDQSPSIGEVRAAEPDLPIWAADLKDHPAFREELGLCTVGEPAEIITEGPPIRQRVRRLPLIKREQVEAEVDKMLEQGVIRPSQSPWASPVTLVPKKDGTTRFCVDFRRVNDVTRKDAHPLPIVQDIFDTLGKSTVFSAIDLRSAYWQVALSSDAIPKTAFACHRGLYEFTRIPYGLCNAPGQFQRIMQKVLGDLVGTVCMVYLDDVIIFSRSKDEHARHVRAILDRIGAAGMTLKLAKCKFGLERLDLLGYTVARGSIEPQESKVKAIRDLAPPTTVKEVRSFLGMTGYYHQCLPRYAHVAAPLTARAFYLGFC